MFRWGARKWVGRFQLGVLLFQKTVVIVSSFALSDIEGGGEG